MVLTLVTSKAQSSPFKDLSGVCFQQPLTQETVFVPPVKTLAKNWLGEKEVMCPKLQEGSTGIFHNLKC